MVCGRQSNGGTVGIADRPTNVVMAAHIVDPTGRCRRGGQCAQGPHRKRGISRRKAGPQHDHQLVVIGEMALGTLEMMNAKVRQQVCRSDNGLGFQQRGRRSNCQQRPVHLCDQVGFGLILAIGAQPLPSKGNGIESEHIDTQVGQVEHDSQHLEQHVGVGVVKIPLVGVEGGPHPAIQFGVPSEVARGNLWKYLG